MECEVQAYSPKKPDAKPRIFITIGLLLAGLTLFAVLEAYEKKTNVEKEQENELLFFFFNSLSNGDSATAYKYVWSGGELKYSKC